VAVVAVSAAAVLVRLAEGVHPVALAFWRTAAVAGLLAPFAGRRLLRLSLRDVGLTALAGALLAAHFWAWFASLALTSVLRSTVLVTLAPIWAGLLEWLVLRDPPGRRFWVGIAVALPGVAVMSAGEGLGEGRLAGDALALLGGLFTAGYYLAGRSVRQRADIATYGAGVCGSAALCLALVAVCLGAGSLGSPLVDLPAAAWPVIAAMAFGPQLLGHIGFNWAVRWLPASLVSGIILLEPVGATILAALVLAELPSAVALVGGAFVVAGVGFILVPSNPH
jgi:drug/metabolite transporter (DMT)-like permease